MAYATLCERFIGELLQEPSAFGCAVLLGMQTRRAPPPSYTRFRHNAVLYSLYYFTTRDYLYPDTDPIGTGRSLSTPGS